MKRIYKYGTGEKIPEGAVYLNTVAQTQIEDPMSPTKGYKNCWLVWHYFLVEVVEEDKQINCQTCGRLYPKGDVHFEATHKHGDGNFQRHCGKDYCLCAA